MSKLLLIQVAWSTTAATTIMNDEYREYNHQNKYVNFSSVLQCKLHVCIILSIEIK